MGSRGDNKLDEVFKAGHKAYVKLDGVASKSGISFSPYPFPVVSGASTVVEKDSASSRSIPVALAPKIIQRSGGVAITAQDAVTKRNVMESLQWRNFMQTADLQHSFAEDANEAAAWLAIQRLYASLPIQDGLAILRGGEPKGVKVVAEVALKAGAMVLSPLLQRSNRIVSRTTQPWTLPTGTPPPLPLFTYWAVRRRQRFTRRHLYPRMRRS